MRIGLARTNNPNVGKRLSIYGPETNKMFFQALGRYRVQGKHVLVVGSESPWIEAMCLVFGAASVTTVDYSPPQVQYPNLHAISLRDLDRRTSSTANSTGTHSADANSTLTTSTGTNSTGPGDSQAQRKQYDAVFCYSSLEHDGLGRYGDPVDPDADLALMRRLKRVISDKGVLFLGVPMGKDSLVFNLHRIYGPIRFPKLVQGWRRVALFGGSMPKLFKQRLNHYRQPLHVLRPA